jgi:hypothetical protein
VRKCSRVLGCAVIALVLALASARAEDEVPLTWADPTLEDALVAARIVVRGHIQAPLAGETEPRLAIEKVVAGDGKPGVSVPLWGTKGPPSLDPLLPRLATGDEGIFICRQAGDPDKARLELFTPSFGRFAIHKDGRVAAFVRSSFVSVEMKADDYETFLRNAWASVRGQKGEVAFVDSCRATLASLDPTAGDSALPAHVALEGLRYFAEPKDAKLALRFFACSRFQIRVSAARLLERAGGEDGADGLMRLALNDGDPVVASVAIEGIGRVKPTPKGAAAELLAHLRDMDAKANALHVNVEDPRTNEQQGPMYAAFETLRGLGSGDDATRIAVELLSKEDMDPFMAGVLHLAKMKAKTRVPEIVAKMRAADHPYGVFNENLGKLLEELTGEALGDSKEAWQAWLKK